MLITDNLKISINRGDTGTILITFTGQDVPPDGTAARIALQRSLEGDNVLWEKEMTVESGRVTLPLFTQDTDYPYGKYWWGIRLLYENGDIYTVTEKPVEFRILPVAGTLSAEEAEGGDADG